jgi:hypothetical protein
MQTKSGNNKISNATKKWLEKNGWKVPKECQGDGLIDTDKFFIKFLLKILIWE